MGVETQGRWLTAVLTILVIALLVLSLMTGPAHFSLRTVL